MSQKRNGGCVGGMAKIGILGILVVAGIAYLASKAPKPTAEEQAENEKRMTRENAYYAAREYIKGHLKAPSTAKWSIYPNRDTGSEELEGKPGHFRAIGYVDAENSFGAKLRQTWTANMLKGSNVWYFYRATLGDQTLIDIEAPTKVK